MQLARQNLRRNLEAFSRDLGVFPNLMNGSSHLRPILVVDDDETSLELIRMLLRRVPVANPILTARSAAEAKTLLLRGCPASGGRRSRKPILILLDVNMPGLSGLDLLKWIKRKKALSRIRVVIWSNAIKPDDEKRAAELKADGYLLKFPNTHILGAIVRAANLWAEARTSTNNRAPSDKSREAHEVQSR